MADTKDQPSISVRFKTHRVGYAASSNRKSSGGWLLSIFLAACVIFIIFKPPILIDELPTREAIAAFYQANSALLIQVILTLGFSLLTLYPVVSYVYFSWCEKQAEIFNSLTTSGKKRYLALFQKSEPSNPNASIDAQFIEMYNLVFGRWRFFAPAFFLFCGVSVDSWFLAASLLSLKDDAPLTVAAAAATGAYTYVTFDLILRQQRRDLSPADVLRGALRLGIGIPLGIAFGWFLGSEKAFLAFAVGVFPLETIALILRRLLNKRLGLQIGVDGSVDQVISLSGVDASTADRIQQADITTITQLAWCDPVQLSMRSNLSFAYVTDIVSQALAWVYFTKKLCELAPFGLRGAFEFRSLWLSLNSDIKQEVDAANAVLASAAAVLGIGVMETKNAIEQIAEDPCTVFIYDTYGIDYREERANSPS